ncbi:radical SAM protein [Paraburkholderia sp. Cpub6]|uniref:radical SAM protein n=1 Tax=Paraburkholderia sp. Cpub6 TaxID=2723094 RepID=UPI001620F2CE|nr:radical SAM protein [Paraburkholderia sp. Cpub6]MBB5463092.1 MoaA/NifB/PqqE/SkfB family radical SAM enzyme [Paraburkholderia sp. Cpub6]
MDRQVVSDGLTGLAPVLHVHPLRLCNLACAHCYSSSGPHAKGELPIDLLVACLKDAFQLGYRQVAISGGEPLLYGHLREVLIGARDLGMLTTLVSNGMLANGERWERITPYLDFAAISVDGRPEEHDAIRRRRGAFDITVSNFETIRASGIPFGILFTLTQHNVDSLDFVVRLAATVGARSVQVHPLSLQGRAIGELPESRPDDVELIAALCEVTRLGETCGVAVHVDVLTMEQLLQHRHLIIPSLPVTSLTNVLPVLIVRSDAYVLPLTHDINPAFWLGTLNERSLACLAQSWLGSGLADKLVDACARTWAGTVESGTPAVYWFDEVAARTYSPALAT